MPIIPAPSRYATPVWVADVTVLPLLYGVVGGTGRELPLPIIYEPPSAEA